MIKYWLMIVGSLILCGLSYALMYRLFFIGGIAVVLSLYALAASWKQFTHARRALSGSLAALLLVLLIGAPAWAQTVRDAAGNPLYHYSQEGNRNYRVDNAGNKQGYSVVLPNGNVEFRDKVGNLRGTETPHR